ncbi:MAG: hypothetical protein CUN56_02625 [Phototrophicales bacterium]|nr:MAG: hypothetical protein CUN56_02625 [Phototrophicales bacterium]RMG75837.1 MAG: FHA domain-containing protein [Chloroflexota bacterium]
MQPIEAKGQIVIQIVQQDAEDNPVLQLDSPGVEGYVIGRSDEGSSYQPDIDLTAHNAQSLGLSRRHAALVRYRGYVHVMDLGSMNGTFINGERLLPFDAYALKSGDQVSLANLLIRVLQEL